MKKIYLLIFFITNISFSQSEINLDNSLTCNIIETSNIKNIGIIYSGNNIITIKKTTTDFLTNYSYLTDTQNEFLQRINVSNKFKNQQVFLTYQFNSSYLRDIRTDNWIGIGYGFKKQIKQINFGLSYATIYQYTSFYNNDNKKQLRHSFRGKLKYDNENLSIKGEYWYQPSYQSYKDYIITGNTKFDILPKNNFSFIIQDIFSYNSKSLVRMVHTISFGIQYKFDKKI